jgi:hypothetical protein
VLVVVAKISDFCAEGPDAGPPEVPHPASKTAVTHAKTKESVLLLTVILTVTLSAALQSSASVY